MVSRPPRVCTSTSGSSQPSRMPATTAAQAPVPQASVSPAPRSCTRRRTSRRDTTCRKPALTWRGKRGWVSMRGPSSATGAVSTSCTRCTACGLPIDSTAMSTDSMLVPGSDSGQSSKPLTWLLCSRGLRPEESNGISACSKIGWFMSTVTRPSASTCSSIRLLTVSTLTRTCWLRPVSRTKRAKQRAPLPHCSTSSPLPPLKMRYRKSTPGVVLRSTTRIWSAPTPKRRSPRNR